MSAGMPELETKTLVLQVNTSEGLAVKNSCKNHSSRGIRPDIFFQFQQADKGNN